MSNDGGGMMDDGWMMDVHVTNHHGPSLTGTAGGGGVGDDSGSCCGGGGGSSSQTMEDLASLRSCEARSRIPSLNVSR